jgi:hypothetical protein
VATSETTNRTAQRHRLDGRIELLATLSEADLFAVHRRSSVFGLGRRIIGDGDRDDIPNVLMEAMAAGLPVISTSSSGVSELIEDDINERVLLPQDKPASVVRRRSEEGMDAIEAEVVSSQHDVVHTRRVLFPGGDYWVVHDHVRGDQDHRYEARWRLPADAEGRVRVVPNSKQTTVITPAGRLVMPTSVSVDIEPGWVSPTCGIKEPAPVVVVRASGAHADFITVLSPGTESVTMIDQTSDGSLHCSILRGNTTDLIRWSPNTDVAWDRWSA